MRRYFLCEYCGEEGKGYYNCDCHAKKDKEMSERLVGCTIVKSEIIYDSWMSVLEQTMQDKEGNIFTVTIFLDNEPGSKIIEVKVKENGEEK